MQNFLMLTILCFVIAISGCKKSINPTVNNDNVFAKLPIESKNVQSTIRGMVIDEQGMKVANAVIKIGNVSSITDANGLFSFPNIITSQFATVVQVSKTDFVTAYKTLLIVENNTLNLTILLCKPTLIVTFKAADGLNISLQNMHLGIPANSIVYDGTNELFIGTVTAQIFNPNLIDSFYAHKRPGLNVGIDRNNKLVMMTPFEMIGVELKDNAGKKLQLKPDTKAKLSYTIPTNMINNAPSILQLSHFDEQLGYWRQVGAAFKNGNSYEATVSHFSFYEYEFYPIHSSPYLKSASVYDSTTNSLLYGYTVEPHLNFQSILGNDLLLPHSMMSFTYFFASDTATGNIDVRDACGNIVHNYTFDLLVNPGSTHTILPSSVLNSIQIQATIVDCYNNPLPDAVVYYTEELINDYGERKQFIVNASGQIEFTTSLCKAGTPYSIIAYDNVLHIYNYYSFIIPTNNTNLGNLQACGRKCSYIKGLKYGQQFPGSLPYYLRFDAWEPTWKITAKLDASGVTKVSALDFNYLRETRWCNHNININFDGNGTFGMHLLLDHNGHRPFSDNPSEGQSFDKDTFINNINIVHYSFAPNDSITGNYFANTKYYTSLSNTILTNVDTISFSVNQY